MKLKHDRFYVLKDDNPLVCVAEIPGDAEYIANAIYKAEHKDFTWLEFALNVMKSRYKIMRYDNTKESMRGGHWDFDDLDLIPLCRRYVNLLVHHKVSETLPEYVLYGWSGIYTGPKSPFHVNDSNVNIGPKISGLIYNTSMGLVFGDDTNMNFAETKIGNLPDLEYSSLKPGLCSSSGWEAKYMVLSPYEAYLYQTVVNKLNQINSRHSICLGDKHKHKQLFTFSQIADWPSMENIPHDLRPYCRVYKIMYSRTGNLIYPLHEVHRNTVFDGLSFGQGNIKGLPLWWENTKLKWKFRKKKFLSKFKK